ncbi:MAG: sigma-70 family RNA polymerase sigma factor [Chloroflexi bacterium]|nr:sigma-70 family RNA polymerase sigma factor [Chloroflexota bacterium]
MTTVRQQQDDELVWIQRAKKGDHAAFARIVQAYQRPVYNLCYRMLSDPEEAEDAAQEAFLRAYTNLHRYDSQRKFVNWMLSIASNHCIDRLRKRRVTWVSFEDTPLVEQLSTKTEGPQRRAERSEEAAELQQWIDKLPPNYRTPLVLLYWYELSYEEIAETLKLSVPAVKSRLHRARKRVAELMIAGNAVPQSATRPHAPAAASG